MKKILFSFSFLIMATAAFSQVSPERITPPKEPVIVAVLPVTKKVQPKKNIIISTEANKTRANRPNTSNFPQEGTYQVVISQQSLTFDISDETLSLISKKRDAEKVTYLTINEFVTIKILPYNLIRSEEFVPLKTYSYEN